MPKPATSPTPESERKIPIDHMPRRPLKVYAFDPTRGHSLGNQMDIQVNYEPLQPGPIGNYLAVIDYDASNKCYYEPVNLDDPAILLGNGLEPSESDPRFHQQMVYAVSSETIRRFEYALGRSIRWSFARWGKVSAERERLRIFPHAMQEANAYYSRALRGLVFGYFRASATDAGDNLPNQIVFTCLSHDIVAHETTHALVDSQRDYFMEPTSFDAPAFHEAFADIVALFQHFSYKESVLQMIQRTGGNIFRSAVGPEVQPASTGAVISAELTTDNPLVGLARQFGHAMGMRGALRSALGTPPNTHALDNVYEPHLRGSILVAAVFDAFFSIYVRRTADLMRVARAGGLQLSTGELHPDIASRLAETVTKTADHFLNICIRALDYCPPVDILFGDFLRAMITADYELVPNDPYGYRSALIDAFRSRGIVPENVASFSEESLRWSPPEAGRHALPKCEGLEFDVFNYADEARRRQQQKSNGRILHKFATENWESLSLSRDLPTQARTFHEVHRIGPDGRLIFDVVAELTQHRNIPSDPDNPNSPPLTFRGGTTLILRNDGTARYSVQKSIGDPKNDAANPRLLRQRAYQTAMANNMPLTAFFTSSVSRTGPVNFDIIHRGY